MNNRGEQKAMLVNLCVNSMLLPYRAAAIFLSVKGVITMSDPMYSNAIKAEEEGF